MPQSGRAQTPANIAAAAKTRNRRRPASRRDRVLFHCSLLAQICVLNEPRVASSILFSLAVSARPVAIPIGISVLSFRLPETLALLPRRVNHKELTELGQVGKKKAAENLRLAKKSY